MLSEVLQGTEPGGFVIIRDSVYYSGRPLLKYYINCALKRGEAVHVLGFEVPEHDFSAKLDSSCLNLFHFHNAYSDPLGWTRQSLFTVKHFSATDITKLLQETQHAKASVLVIDSLSFVVRHHDPVAVCQELQKLRKAGSSVRMIFGLLHMDLHQQGVMGALSHLASTVISVTPVNNARYAVANTTHRKKSGKVMQKEEFFSLTEDLTLSIETKPNQFGNVQTDLHIESEVDPVSNLTFNLRLSEVEREAKEKVALPFVFSEKKKSALLRQGQGSGRVMYEPDANDDFDEEDPDDDLDV
ncbi:elongator complex protein 5 isoform X1 [Tachysurus fulvidraco]|uniref:elongator complex protein 5 isoform X1 n=1 Tax=Tachysurus fulvidraco TaxID=1234273 RepID=UPI000F50EF98|nr:elongator complex protein 5 isoform X1 [Tachysurus fulvidraco]